MLTEGHVEAGDEIVRTARGPHALSVAELDALLYLPGHDPERLQRGPGLPALSPGWRESFRSMLESDDRRRLSPPASRSRRRRRGPASAP